MKTIQCQNYILCAGVLFLALCSNTAFAKKSAEDGLQKIKSNIDNSKLNLEDYKKNLQVVEKNISEVMKAKAQVDDQKKQVSSQIKENQAGLKKIDNSDKELNQLINDEKQKTVADEKKIKELEDTITKLKENLAVRAKNISDYQVQQTQVQEEKVWATRSEALKEQDKQVNDKLKTVVTQENEWKNKKRGYEGEIGRWNKEIEKQQKTYDTYKNMSDVKE